MVINTSDKICKAFDADSFRKDGHKIVDLLADYMEKAVNGSPNLPVLPETNPIKFYNEWKAKEGEDKTIIDLAKKVIEKSNHLHHPHYIGHQVPSVLPIAALCDFITAFLNNSVAVFELSPIQTIMEKEVISIFCKLIDFPETSGGFVTSGGSLGNLTALLAARQIKCEGDCWKEGISKKSNMSILVSEQAHYSCKRHMQIMGFGEKNIIMVPSKQNGSISIEAIRASYQQATENGKKIFAVIASACSTSTGVFDPLEFIADFCEEKDLWFHVDGAHGAPTIFSKKYAYLLKGIERADSVVWDAHKMMMVPSLATAVLFRKNEDSFKAIQQDAPYLYKDKLAKEENWYDASLRNLECTKNGMSFKIYACLKILGEEFYDDYITKVYDQARIFAEMIKQTSDFELVAEPESNILCFRYIKSDLSVDEINKLQKQILEQILASGEFYFCQTVHKGAVCLRCTIMNPLTNESHFQKLLDKIRDVALQI